MPLIPYARVDLCPLTCCSPLNVTPLGNRDFTDRSKWSGGLWGRPSATTTALRMEEERSVGTRGDSVSRGRQRPAVCLSAQGRCVRRQQQQELEETREGSPLRVSEGARPCQHLDVELRSCKTARQGCAWFEAPGLWCFVMTALGC